MTTLTAQRNELPGAAVGQGRADRMIRRVSFFRKMGLFGGQGARFEVCRAIARDDLQGAYRLVHDCYVERGYMKPSPDGVRTRPFEAMPEMATFVAKVAGQVVAVTSVLMDSPELHLPSDKAFGPELEALRSQGRRICEITNLAVHPSYRNTSVFAELTRCSLAHAQAVGYDDLFIAISPEHGRFFQEVLLFQPWGGRRSYSAEVEDIVVGMRLDLRTIEGRAVGADRLLAQEAFLHEFYFAGNPFHARVRRWAVRAAGMFGDVALLRDLFGLDGGLLRRLSAEEERVIRSRWGSDVFEQVLQGGSVRWSAEAAEAAAEVLAA